MPHDTGKPTAAWKQFLIGKQVMLDEYDRARVHAKSQAVQTHHVMGGKSGKRTRPVCE